MVAVAAAGAAAAVVAAQVLAAAVAAAVAEAFFNQVAAYGTAPVRAAAASAFLAQEVTAPQVGLMWAVIRAQPAAAGAQVVRQGLIMAVLRIQTHLGCMVVAALVAAILAVRDAVLLEAAVPPAAEAQSVSFGLAAHEAHLRSPRLTSVLLNSEYKTWNILILNFTFKSAMGSRLSIQSLRITSNWPSQMLT
jgi:hypothetical protein